MKLLKVDLFEDEIFIFTPKGEVKSLPVDSTPIDFAFDVHTQVGLHCIGAKVNGKIVPLNTVLINGDSIEIITWNCEFFPHANDSTILALAEAVLDLNVDIIAFQELRRTGWFSKLMAYLPEYDFIVSQQASFMDLAIIYKNNMY